MCTDISTIPLFRYGFIHFETLEIAKHVCEQFNRKQVKGKRLIVQLSKDTEKQELLKKTTPVHLLGQLHEKRHERSYQIDRNHQQDKEWDSDSDMDFGNNEQNRNLYRQNTGMESHQLSEFHTGEHTFGKVVPQRKIGERGMEFRNADVTDDKNFDVNQESKSDYTHGWESERKPYVGEVVEGFRATYRGNTRRLADRNGSSKRETNDYQNEKDLDQPEMYGATGGSHITQALDQPKMCGASGGSHAKKEHDAVDEKAGTSDDELDSVENEMKILKEKKRRLLKRKADKVTHKMEHLDITDKVNHTGAAVGNSDDVWQDISSLVAPFKKQLQAEIVMSKSNGVQQDIHSLVEPPTKLHHAGAVGNSDGVWQDIPSSVEPPKKLQMNPRKEVHAVTQTSEYFHHLKLFLILY